MSDTFAPLMTYLSSKGLVGTTGQTLPNKRVDLMRALRSYYANQRVRTELTEIDKAVEHWDTFLIIGSVTKCLPSLTS